MIKYYELLFYVLIMTIPGPSLSYAEASSEKQDTIRENIEEKSLKAGNSLVRKYAYYQKEGRVTISRTMRKLRKDFNLKIFLWLFLFSFGYGILHAAGPGHGKAIVTFYLLHCKASVKDALKLVGIIVVTHIGLAVLLAFLFHTVLVAMKNIVGITLQNNFGFIGGIVIILIGTILFIRELKSKGEIKRSSVAVSNTNICLIGITAGIVPCPISLTIMSISLSTGTWYIGFTSVLAISLGLALLLFLVAVCVEKSREGIIRLPTANPKITIFLSNLFSYGGLIVLILLGIFISIFYYKGI